MADGRAGRLLVDRALCIPRDSRDAGERLHGVEKEEEEQIHPEWLGLQLMMMRRLAEGTPECKPNHLVIVSYLYSNTTSSTYTVYLHLSICTLQLLIIRCVCLCRRNCYVLRN